MRKFETGILKAAMLAAILAASAQGASAQTVIKFAHVDPPDWTISKKGAASQVFKDIVEAESGGKITVELYPAG
jgi:TRAP-type C4-dicarboxylate transport system substrate-binding protein